MTTKTKKVKKIRTATDIAKELAQVRRRLLDDGLLNKALTESFKNALQLEGKSEAGNYKLTKSYGLRVVEPDTAIQWAATTNCLTIDLPRAKEVLRHTLDDPSQFGFERTISDRVEPIRKQNEG